MVGSGIISVMISSIIPGVVGIPRFPFRNKYDDVDDADGSGLLF